MGERWCLHRPSRVRLPPELRPSGRCRRSGGSSGVRKDDQAPSVTDTPTNGKRDVRTSTSRKEKSGLAGGRGAGLH